MPDLDVLVIGDCNPDLVLYGDNIEPAFGQAERLVEGARLVMGGSAAIAAAGLARLGLRAGLVSVVGDDLLGRFMLDELQDRGVDVAGCVVDQRLDTGLSVILCRPGDRAIITAPGAIPELAADLINPRLIGSARHVHVSSYFLLDALRGELAGVLGPARAGGATVSLDPNWDPSGRWDGGLAALLPMVDVLLPNEEEVRRLARLDSAAAAAAALAGAGPTVVVKRGADGALAVPGATTRLPGRRAAGSAPGAGASPVHVHPPALPDPVVDTIGAGDSFDAGLLTGLLAGRGLEAAAALGCACGAASTRALGGTAGQPTLAEAERLTGIAA